MSVSCRAPSPPHRGALRDGGRACWPDVRQPPASSYRFRARRLLPTHARKARMAACRPAIRSPLRPSAASRAVIGRAGGRAGWLPRPVRSAVIAWPFFVRPRGRFRSTCTSAKRPAVAAERSTVSNAPQRSPCGFLNRRGAHLNSSVFADTGRGRVRHCAPPPTSSAFASCGHSVA